jgi:hypothetical protein
MRKLLSQDESLMAAFLCRANGRLAFVGITPARVVVSPGLVHKPGTDVMLKHDGYTKVEEIRGRLSGEIVLTWDAERVLTLTGLSPTLLRATGEILRQASISKSDESPGQLVTTLRNPGLPRLTLLTGGPSGDQRRMGGESRQTKHRRPLDDRPARKRIEVVASVAATSSLLAVGGKLRQVHRATITITKKVLTVDALVEVGSIFRSKTQKLTVHRIAISRIDTAVVEPREFLDGPWLQLRLRGSPNVVSIETPYAAMLVKTIEQIQREAQVGRSDNKSQESRQKHDKGR